MGRSNPRLWESAKKTAVSRMGGHSARAMQLAANSIKKEAASTQAQKLKPKSL